MGQKPNWSAIDRTAIGKEEFWNNIQPNQYSTTDLFYLKDRTRFLMGSDAHYIVYWFWSVLLFIFSFICYKIVQIPTKDLHTHDVNIGITIFMLLCAIALIPYSFHVRKKQLRQIKLLNNCRSSLDKEIDRRDTVAYLSKYQPHEHKIS